MKIILSHDVDHLYWTDHLLDTYIPGLFYRNLRQWLQGSIDRKMLFQRLNVANSLNNLEALTEKLTDLELPATFFFATKRGLNLSYRWQKAGPFIRKLKDLGFEFGLHGMDFSDIQAMAEEKRLLENMIGQPVMGIRNHYLRKNENTLSLMAQTGYYFDSTEYGLTAPYKVGDLWEFPITLMDVTIAKKVGFAIDQLKGYSKKTIDEAIKVQLPYFVVNFHDVYYCDAYDPLKEWFDWIVEEFIKNGFQFVSFDTATKELSSSQ